MPDLSRTVILFVDDEAILLITARLIFERAGYFVLTAENGVKALEVSREFPGPIHLLVSDVRMPIMNGVELCRHIAVERPATKLLLMSAFVDSPLQGCPFLRKPFHMDLLLQRVHELVGSASVTAISRF